MVEWFLYPIGLYVALWAATSFAEQRLVAPSRVISGYLLRLLAFRPPPNRLREGTLTWNQTVQYRWEWLIVTFLTVFYISPALPLTPGWRTAAEFMWLVLAARLAYSRGIRHPSGRLVYYILGGLMLAALFWSAILWLWLESLREIPSYWYLTVLAYTAWPIPSAVTRTESHTQTHSAH